MPGCSFGPGAAVLLLACVAGLLGCESDGERRGPAASAQSATVTPGAPRKTSEPAQASVEPARTDCASAERRAARDIWLWAAIREVTGAPTRTSADARDTLEKHTEKAATKLGRECDGQLPQAFEKFTAELEPILRRPLGNREVDELLRAWRRWGSAVGAPRASRDETDDLESCRREFFPRFAASHRVWWKWTETGKAWWVEISFDNRTGKVLYGGMDGRAVATKLLPDPFGWAKDPKPGPGKDATLSWGGSSADFLELQPGVTELTAAPDADQDVHTTAEGTFRVTEIAVGLTPRGEGYQCYPPVPATG